MDVSLLDGTQRSHLVPHTPADMPRVWMDTGLGKKYNYVDFDYAAYDRAAEEVGIPRDDRALEFGVARSLGLGNRGYYTTDKTLCVRAGRDVNKSAVHEMTHAADEANDILGDSGTIRYELGNMGNFGIIPSGLVTLGSEIANRILTEHPLLFELTNEASMFGLFTTVTLGGLAVWGYVMHPDEIRARRAGRKNKEHIIALEKKTLHSRASSFVVDKARKAIARYSYEKPL